MWTLGLGLGLAALLMWAFWARRASERAVRLGRRSEALLENSSDVALILNPAGVIRYASRALEAMLAHSVEQVVGTPLLDLAHPDERARVEQSVQEASRGEGRAVCQWRARHASGSYLDVESATLDCHDDDSIRGSLVMIRSLGERRVSRRSCAIRPSTTR